MRIQGFSTERIKVETSDGRVFSLLEAFSYTRKDGQVVEVPVGSESNGASTPRLLWRVFPPFGRYWKAAFLHDHLYERGEYEKTFCDETFMESMEWLGVPETVARTLYEGVHLLGWPAWKECRDEPTLAHSDGGR